MDNEKWNDGADKICLICQTPICKGQPFTSTISQSPQKRSCSHFFCEGGTMTIIGASKAGIVEVTQYGNNVKGEI